jgi:RsiW-degrading membrane proteinase PrsW (M82 family)
MTAALVATLAAAIAPGLFWTWLFRSRDWRQPEPWRLVARCFLLGAVIAVPTAIGISLAPAGVGRSVGLAPLVEEAAKLLVVWLAVWRNPAFDERADGLVYAAAAGLGFATVEAVGYSLVALLAPGALSPDPAISPLAAGVGMALLRGLITGPGHAIWACAWGAPLARLRLEPGAANAVRLVAGFALAVGAHAAFNALSLVPTDAARLAMVAMTLVGLLLVLAAFRRLVR